MALLNPFRIGQGMLNQPPYPYGSLGADKMPYWDGNQLRIPSFTPKPWEFMAPDSSSPSVPSAAQMEQPTSGILGGMYGGGDGGAGNGVGGGPAPSAAPDQQGVPDGFGQAQTGMQPGGFGVSNPAGPTAPAPGMAPAQGLAVGEVDPQGPSGATSTGKSKGSADVGPDKSAAGLAARSATAKGLAEDQANAAIGKVSTNFMDAVKGLMDQTRGMLGANTDMVGLGIATNPEENASVSANVSGENAGMSTSGDTTGEGGNSNGTGGSTGSPAGNTGATDPGQDNTGGHGAGSTWRKGGFVGDDGDNKLEARRGILHEREFVINPEMAKALQKHAPGILNKMDRAQKKMMRR